MRALLRYGWMGFLLGLAFNQAANLLASYALNLGYYAPCLTMLGEMFGGELHAATVQALGIALLFTGISLIVGQRRT